MRFNNFGGTLGGPVRIPHLYDGHDRTFFFLSIEDVVMIQPQETVSRPVPTLEARQHAPPLVAALLNAYPLPNRSSSASGDPAVTGFSDYVGTGSLKHDQQIYGLRLDHAFNEKLMSFVRYNRAPSNRLYGLAPFLQKYSLGTETLTIGLTQALTPKMVNEIRLNGSRQFDTLRSVINNSGGAHRPPDSLFFPPGYSSNDSFVTFGLLPWYVQLGFAQREASRQLQIVDNLSWSSGAHQFKAGADYRWFSPVTTLYRFSPTVTFDSLYGPTGAYTGIIPDAPQAFNKIPSTAFVVQAFSAYVQDTWKARRGLTLTYGLRWEVNPAPRVSAGQAVFVRGITNPADFSTIDFVPSGKPIYATSWSNFAPRLGIGWQIHDGPARKTVLRIGAGRFFDLGQGGFESGGYNALTFVGYTDQPLGSPTGGSPYVLGTFGPAGELGNAAVSAAHGYNLPYTWQWNATMEQSIGQQTFSVGYVGALGRRLVGWTIGPGAVYYVMNNLSSSSYNAMQLQFNRRLSSRLRMLVSYTWSHSIDNLSQDTPYPNLMYSVSSDPRARGSSDFDVRHSLNGSIIAALPSPRRGIAGLLFRNWTANSIFFARSALPTDLVLQYSLYRPDVVPGQPLYLYGSGFPGGKSVNGAAFSIPPKGLDGDLGRNVLRGLGAWQIDFSLHREFRVSEGLSLQLRAEVFNIFNHPNFANPNEGTSPGRLTFAPDPGFGSSTQMLANGLGRSDVLGQLSPLFQIGGPRSMQFALRVRF